MKILSLLFFVCFSLLGTVFSQADDVSGLHHPGSVILHVSWGMSDEELGFKGVDKETEAIGFSSFFVTSEETVYFLDTLNRKIKVYRNGKFVKAYECPTKYFPVDLLYIDGSIYVLTTMTIDRLEIKSNKVSSIELVSGSTHGKHSLLKV